jgi:hypothetical protein
LVDQGLIHVKTNRFFSLEMGLGTHGAYLRSRLRFH